MRYLVLFGALVGCTGDTTDTTDTTDDTEDSDVPSCGFTGSFSGAAQADLDYGDDVGCSGSGYEDQLGMSFGIDEVDWLVQIEIFSGVVPGEPSSDLPAAVELVDPDLGYDGWRTGDAGCTVDVVEMIPDDFFDWIVVGEGTCSEPATPDTDQVSGEVTVGAFTFRAPGGWPS